MSSSQMETSPSSEGSSACPGVEVLEALMAREADSSNEAIAAHLDTCPRCRAQLEEMRAAHAFLARFQQCSEAASSHDATALEGPSPRTIRVPGYEVDSLIALGGQGSVYKARQTATGRDVAIKVPLRDTQRRPSTRYRFQREIELTARLNHPGIVRVFGDCRLDDGRIGCVMEFVEGIPVDCWSNAARSEGSNGVRRIVELMTDVADAIAYAHQHVVMHRDIKPSNVIVTPEGKPRVLDFGLAKALNESGAPYSTQTGGFVGTLVYAAPEQVSGQDVSDLRTDVYALGLLLFQALTGRLPHPIDAPTVEILERIRDTVPPRPSSLMAHVGTELDAIVLMALAKEKERRYTSAGAFADDLRRWLADEPVRARFDSRWYVTRKIAWRHRRSMSVAAVAVAALLIIVSLWLSARSEARQAELARVVRDARTLAAHQVRMSEIRSVARENFEAGERLAWDAFLEPEPVLVREGVEGVTAAGPIPTSPAYWALWEIYLRNAIVASIPSDVGGLLAFASARELLAPRNGELLWWDWRTGALVDRLPIPLRDTATTLSFAADTGLLVLADGRGPAVVVDTRRRSVLTVGEAPIDAALLSGRRLATRGGAARQGMVELWDLAEKSPRPLPVGHLSRVITMCFDSTGRYFAVTESTGKLLLVSSETGEVLLERQATEETQFSRVGSRGKIGELIFWGPSAWGTVDLGATPRVVAGPGESQAVSARSAAKAFYPTASATRYLYVTDRFQLGFGDVSEPITKGAIHPGLAVRFCALSPDDRYVALVLAGSRRCAILDLEPEQPKRLPHPIDGVQTGRATIFDLEFTEDSAWLYTGAMDGSIRRYATRDGRVEILAAPAIEQGVTRLSLLDDEIYAGGHEGGSADTQLVRLTPAAAPETLLTEPQWFCGMTAEPGVAVWALTAEGRLTRIDARTGSTLRASLADLSDYRFRALERLPGMNLLVVGNIFGELFLVRSDTLAPAGGPFSVGGMRDITVSPTEPGVFATANDDGMIRLWRLSDEPSSTLSQIGELRSHTGPVFCVAFHPSGRFIASGGGGPEPKDVRLWDRITCRELAALDLFDVGVFDIEFSPDGRWLAAGGECRFDRPEEGGLLYLIDLQAPNHGIAGSLEYHLARFEREHGRLPENATPLRAWAASAPGVAP
jgi:WD40 repeat protein/tRNA A-37 threonylcarbamoyl transferase component Bud32